MTGNNNHLIPIELELRKLDLTEKEIRVYLVCLEKKRASIGEIARSASLSRPTTYRAIETLSRKGLLSKVKKNKTHLVVVQPPNEILGLVRAHKRRFEEQEREFLRIISLLENKYYFNQRNEIKMFSGREGLELLLEDFLTTQTKTIRVIFFENFFLKARLEKIYGKILKRLGNIEVREIHAKRPGSTASVFIKRKEIPLCNPSSGIAIILNDKLIQLEKDRGIMIENEDVLKLEKTFFDTLWKMG